MAKIKKRNVEMDVVFSAQELAAELRRLADALEKGEAYSLIGQPVEIPGDAEINIEYERDGDEQELEIEIKWGEESEEEEEGDEEESEEEGDEEESEEEGDEEESEEEGDEEESEEEGESEESEDEESEEPESKESESLSSRRKLRWIHHAPFIFMADSFDSSLATCTRDGVCLSLR